MRKLYVDWTFVVVTLFLAGFSLALIWSANPSYLAPQIIYYLIGFVLFFLISQLDKEFLQSLALPLYIFSLILLLVTLFTQEVRGAARWIDIFGFRMQPSELIKPLIILSFASFIGNSHNLLSLCKVILLFLLPVLIIFIQPDLGNVIIYLIVFLSMLVANNLNIKVIAVGLILFLISSPLLWYFLLPYQKERLLSFINPSNDPAGAGYNAIQAMIAVGSGKIFGQGLGRGIQSHLRFLPENHTDFIFASLTEELGLWGAVFLLILYGIMLVKILKLALKASGKFEYLVIVGIFTLILSQVFINVAMNIGLIPITGVTLPLVSAGGSSVIATFIALGILTSFEKEDKQQALVIR